MAIIKERKQWIFDTEGSWSDGSGDLLRLPISSWRTERPVVHPENCTYCGLCYLYCPPQCISPGEEFFPIDLEFCKGCGICARECPTGAIEMIAEGGENDGGT